jgi:hypothetical protein
MSERHTELADAEFERLLLDSARTDVGPSASATSAAWGRFSAAAAGAALISGSAVGLAEATRTLRLATLKWFALGAIGGGVLTAGWFATRTPAPLIVTLRKVASAAPSEQAVAPSAEPPSAPPPRAASTSAASRRSPIPARAVRPEPAASTLAAEIAALDDARSALASGAPHRALALIAAYRRDFPSGQLAREADALAIDALQAEGNHAEAVSRAADFTSRYPDDPHAARLRALTR